MRGCTYAVPGSRGFVLILPADRELQAPHWSATLKRVSSPTRSLLAHTARALEGLTCTLCVVTGACTSEQAPFAADALLQGYGADREGVRQEHQTLVA
ncbi:DUF5133 domain-containing protein [Streptomyces sp. NPDC008343]|uniref:DUF5133 domain-containing protein n=1 Tax=Streptomyces sp. NPDC008343 TaxID=3364828 RepID=UPI0036ED9F0F